MVDRMTGTYILFAAAAVFTGLFGLHAVRGTSVLYGNKSVLMGRPLHEGALGQALQVVESLIDHIPHAIGQVIPVTSVDQHALPAFAVVGTVLGAAAIINAALLDLLQSLHFHLVLLLRGHGLVLLADHLLVVINLYLFFSIHTHSFPERNAIPHRKSLSGSYPHPPAWLSAALRYK